MAWIYWACSHPRMAWIYWACSHPRMAWIYRRAWHRPGSAGRWPASAMTSEVDAALAQEYTLRAEAAFVHLPMALGIDQQHGAGTRAVVVAADEGGAQPALAFQADAGVGQVAVGGAVFVGEGIP